MVGLGGAQAGLQRALLSFLKLLQAAKLWLIRGALMFAQVMASCSARHSHCFAAQAAYSAATNNCGHSRLQVRWFSVGWGLL